MNFRSELDVIKGFVAGTARATALAQYPVASYHLTMYSFQQWFHSSYRARQGKVLENILRKILLRYTRFQDVPENSQKTRHKLHQLLGLRSGILRGDVDVCGIDHEAKRILAIQLRSRDDTGGTTAKSSLVESLQQILRAYPDQVYYELLYLVAVWDERNSQQRSSTVRKFYQALQDHTDLREADFERLGTRLFLRRGIYLQLAYGTAEMLRAIHEWDGHSNRDILKGASEVIEEIQNWDDLWLAYAIASMEVHVQVFRGCSNATLLVRKIRELQLEITPYPPQELQKSISYALDKLIHEWREDTLPVRSLADQILYLRDLLLLYAIYKRHCEKRNTV